MKERGIIFQGWGVRASRNMKPGVWPAEAINPALPIKPMTRRTRNLDFANENPDQWRCEGFIEGCGWRFVGPDRVTYVQCPYGVPGDGLWVRETWMAVARLHDTKPLVKDYGLIYKADPGGVGARPFTKEKRAIDYFTGMDRWRPSIHMPRWASREGLVVKEVRVERVQEISEEDARAEGVKQAVWYRPFDAKDEVEDRHVDGREGLLREWQTCYRNGFATAWDLINGKRGFGWEANPRVWVVSYMRKAK